MQITAHGGEEISKDSGYLSSVALGMGGVRGNVDELTGVHHAFFAVYHEDKCPFQDHGNLLVRVGVLRGAGAGLPASPQHGYILPFHQ